jgi:hypothetical protein
MTAIAVSGDAPPKALRGRAIPSLMPVGKASLPVIEVMRPFRAGGSLARPAPWTIPGYRSPPKSLLNRHTVHGKLRRVRIGCTCPIV